MSDGDPQEPRRGPGRPPGPCSEAELDQRRAAPRTHGRYAQTGVPGVPACKSSTCPAEGGYPCDLREEVERRGGSLSQCLLTGGHTDVVERFRAALKTGDISLLRDLTADLLAAQHVVAAENLNKLLAEGLSIEQELYGKDGTLIGTAKIENPRGGLTLKVLDMVGATAAQQAITPKAGAEARRDEGIGRFAAVANFVRQRRPVAAGIEESDAGG